MRRRGEFSSPAPKQTSSRVHLQSGASTMAVWLPAGLAWPVLLTPAANLTAPVTMAEDFAAFDHPMFPHIAQRSAVCCTHAPALRRRASARPRVVPCVRFSGTWAGCGEWAHATAVTAGTPKPAIRPAPANAPRVTASAGGGMHGRHAVHDARVPLS